MAAETSLQIRRSQAQQRLQRWLHVVVPCVQGWTALALTTHGNDPQIPSRPEAGPGLPLTIAGPIHGVALANTEGLSSPACVLQTADVYLEVGVDSRGFSYAGSDHLHFVIAAVATKYCRGPQAGGFGHLIALGQILGSLRVHAGAKNHGNRL